MNQKLTPSTAMMLVAAPLLRAGNAVVGRMVHTLVPPVTLNFPALGHRIGHFAAARRFHIFHFAAFALVVSGIVVSSRK
jgi:hypothetical protein